MGLRRFVDCVIVLDTVLDKEIFLISRNAYVINRKCLLCDSNNLLLCMANMVEPISAITHDCVLPKEDQWE